MTSDVVMLLVALSVCLPGNVWGFVHLDRWRYVVFLKN